MAATYLREAVLQQTLQQDIITLILRFVELRQSFSQDFLKVFNRVSFLSNFFCLAHNFLFTLAPLDVGPGSYLLDKAELKAIERFKPQKFPPKESNWSSSNRFGDPRSVNTSEQLGPGAYREINKWNKRTYNLKFLNN